MVVVSPVFARGFPDTYVVEFVKEDGTCVICGDRDFAPQYLTVVG